MNQHAISNLTPSQQRAVVLFNRFLANETPLFLLKGYAGTGKTHLLRLFAEEATTAGRPVQLMAPTGRAASILSERLQRHAATIHKSIYTFDKTGNPNAGEDDDDNVKLIFALRSVPDARTLIIVDEASMISDKQMHAEKLEFGSGRLLADLLAYAGSSLGNGVKIVFSGDPAQLPPVQAPVSHALSATYLFDTFHLACSEIELTDPVRQLETSTIYRQATAWRDQITQRNYSRFLIETTGSHDVFVASPDEAVEAVAADAARGHHNAVILCHANRMASDYNHAVRQALNRPYHPIENDRIVTLSNYYLNGDIILNGAFGTIIRADLSDKMARNIPVNFPGGVQETVRLEWMPMLIQFDANDMPPKEINVLTNMLDTTDPATVQKVNRALWIDFLIRNPEWRSASRRHEFSELFRQTFMADPLYNAIRVQYGYALTCHKAQGGEWQTVFTDFRHHLGHCNDVQLRWSYTAITRARTQFGAIGIIPFGSLVNIRLKPVEILSKLPDNFFRWPGLHPEAAPDVSQLCERHLHWLNEQGKAAGITFSAVRSAYETKLNVVLQKKSYQVKLYYSSNGFSGKTMLPPSCPSEIKTWIHSWPGWKITDLPVAKHEAQQRLGDFIVHILLENHATIVGVAHEPYKDVYHAAYFDLFLRIEAQHDAQWVYSSVTLKCTNPTSADYLYLHSAFSEAFQAALQ